MNVLVIEYCNLRFICNLVLEIWDFIVLKASDAIGIEFTLALPRALHVAGCESMKAGLIVGGNRG